MREQNTAAAVGLPVRPFLYTLDQISDLLSIPQPRLERHCIWFDQRSVGRPGRDYMVARNIASDPNRTPDWRVAEHELVRWMKRKGYRFYERGWALK